MTLNQRDGRGARAMRTLTTSLIVLAAVALAAGQSPTVDPQTVGPQIGSTVPSFTLTDQNGQSRTLQSLMGSKGVILVFFRSADW
jgi:cytochrome oxidase Cu insertion factor (SCO1/SenC/PrrC family)